MCVVCAHAPARRKVAELGDLEATAALELTDVQDMPALLLQLRGARSEAELLGALSAIDRAERRGAAVEKSDLVAAAMAARSAPDAKWNEAVAQLFRDVLAGSSTSGPPPPAQQQEQHPAHQHQHRRLSI